MRPRNSPGGWHPDYPGPHYGQPGRIRTWIKKPFALWAVYDRNPGRDDEHGPERFSLLYICEEAVAVFNSLYAGNEQAPEALAIIRPGHGFGGNWTNFEDPRKILARSVLGNPYGQPALLLCETNRRAERRLCWPGFSELVHTWEVPDGEIALWRRPRVEDQPCRRVPGVRGLTLPLRLR